MCCPAGKYLLPGLLSLLFVLSSRTVFADASFHFFGTSSYRSFSGELNLKPGGGLDLGFGFPFSRGLELYARFRLPFKFKVDEPQGQVFSAGVYSHSYQKLWHYSLNAGFRLLGIFREEQKIYPFIGLEFGKTWIAGSSDDSFSGLNTDFSAGLGYRFNEVLSLELFYSYSQVYLDRLKINGDSDKIGNALEEAVRIVGISVFYTVYLPGHSELAHKSPFYRLSL